VIGLTHKEGLCQISFAFTFTFTTAVKILLNRPTSNYIGNFGAVLLALHFVESCSKALLAFSVNQSILIQTENHQYYYLLLKLSQNFSAVNILATLELQQLFFSNGRPHPAIVDILTDEHPRIAK